MADTLHHELDFAAVWRDILGGDFDVTGRGAEYTRGMEVFQASRWVGARTLLELLRPLAARATARSGAPSRACSGVRKTRWWRN